MKLMQLFEIKLRTLRYAHFLSGLKRYGHNLSTTKMSTRKFLTQKKAQQRPLHLPVNNIPEYPLGCKTKLINRTL